MKIKFFSFGRSAVLFTLAVLSVFVFNAYADSTIDEFTAGGDFYNKNNNISIIVNHPDEICGSEWIFNSPASAINISNEGSVKKLNTSVSEIKNLDLFKVGTFNSLDMMIYDRDSQIKRP